MRRLLLILMIALLPVRGWVGDVMAMDMAMEIVAQKLVTIELVANNVHSTRATGQFNGENRPAAQGECAEHAANALIHSTSVADGASSADDATSGHCNTCGVCEICHTVAMANPMASNPPDFIPHTLPSIGSTRFASALTALSQKPPIS